MSLPHQIQKRGVKIGLDKKVALTKDIQNKIDKAVDLHNKPINRYYRY